MYKKLEDVSQELQDLRINGRVKGELVGWDWGNLPYTIVLGSTTYMGGAPASGKTEIIKEFQINLSCNKGWNHVILTPEGGTVRDVFADLCHSYIGKPYIKGDNSMSESERTQAEYFINEHFIVLDVSDKDINYKQFYKLIDQIENEIGKRIHTTLIDPWNELAEDYQPNDLGREDKYLSRVLGEIRKNAITTNRHHFILTHVRDQALIRTNGMSYYPPPHARELAGGQVWFRKGNSVILPWRPPYGLVDDDGVPYKKNELHLRIAKTKPKGTSKNGTYKLYLDVEKYRYYMIINGKKKYAYRGKHEYIKQPENTSITYRDLDIDKIDDYRISTPNKEFDNIENTDLPF